jgi:hypothetical protein
MNDQDLRDCFAMFAMMGLLIRGSIKLNEIPDGAYTIADHMLEARKHKEEEQGIVAIRKRKVSK